MNWLDGDLDNEERAAIEAELQSHAASQAPEDDTHDVVGLLRSSGLMEKTAIHTDILMRFVDGEMSEAEQSCFQVVLGADAQLAADAKWMRQFGNDLRRSFAMDVPVPLPDEFERQLQEKMAQG